MNLGSTLTQTYTKYGASFTSKISFKVTRPVFHFQQTHAGMALANNDPLTLKQTLRKCMCFLYFRVSDKPVWSVPK